jgi:hypothetical protein
MFENEKTFVRMQKAGKGIRVSPGCMEEALKGGRKVSAQGISNNCRQ